MALGVALLMGVAQEATFRESIGNTFRQGASLLRDLLQVLVGSPAGGVTTVSANPCATVASVVGGLVGPTAFCLGPDGGSSGAQADGGVLVAFTPNPVGGGPVTLTASRCPNGPECDAVTFQRFDGGQGGTLVYVSGNIASPTDDLSCALLMRGRTTSGRLLAKFSGAIGAIQFSLSTTTATATLSTVDAGIVSASSPASSFQLGAWHVLGFSYDYVADLSSSLVTYADGVAGTATVDEQGPLHIQNTTLSLGGYIRGTC